MRIGTRQAPSTAQTQPVRVSATAQDFGAGVATALNSFGSALMAAGETEIDIIAAAREREQRQRNARNDLEFIRLQGEQQRAVIEARTNAPPGAQGHTNITYEQLGASFEDFAERTGLDADERLRYAERFEAFQQNIVTNEFRFELEESTSFTVGEIEQTVDSVRAEIHQNPELFNERWLELETAINQADLPPRIREEVIETAQNILLSQLYSAETEQALRQQAPVGETDGSDVVAPGTSAIGRGLLNTYSGVLAQPALPISGDMTSRSEVYDVVANSWGQVMPPGSRIEVSSAARPSGRETSQHYHGNAIDFAVYRPDGSRVMWNDPEAIAAARIGRQLGAGGFGWGPTYMSGNSFHWDMRPGLAVWSDDDGGASDGGLGAAQFRADLESIAPGAPSGDSAGQALLGTIHSVESGYGGRNPYNVLFGGDTFESYSDHPRQRRVDPRTGRSTTAAGRYQFLESTWDFVRERMESEGYDFGAEPFSPVNQDRAALWYAEHRYAIEARRLGLPPQLQDLNTALQSGDREAFRTVRWVLSGESGGGVAWEGLQNLSDEEFYDRMQRNMSFGARGNAERPDIWADPRFESLPFEERLRLDTAAEEAERGRLRSIAEARREQENSIMTEIRTQAAFGNTAEAAALGMQALQAGQITNMENIERIARYTEESRAQQTAAAEQGERRASGIVATPDDMDALNLEAQATGMLQGLRSQEPSAAQQLVLNAQRDGMVPSSVMDALFAQFNSGQGEQQTFAAELMADLYAVNPRAATAGLTREQVADVALANTLARTSATPAEFLDRINQMRAPENAQMRQMRQQEADTLIEERGPTAFYRQMYSWMERRGARMPGPGQLPQFENDSRILFREFYALTGDANAAQEATADVLRHTYTPSPFGGELMQYSPTAPMMNVPTVSGSHEWITRHVEEFAQSEINMLIDREVQAAVAAGASEEEARGLVEADYGTRFEVTDMRIVADTQTLTDLQQHGVPSYQIIYTDQYGMLRQLRDADNNVMRIPMRPPEEYQAAAAIGAQAVHAEALVDRRTFGPAAQALRTGFSILGAAANPLSSPGVAAANMEPRSELPSLEETETVASDRLYEDLQEYSDRILVLTRDQLLSGYRTPDSFSHPNMPDSGEPPRSVTRTVEQINRILQERAQQ